MKEQISDLEYTIPSGNFDKFYEAATGNNKCPVGMNDIRRCLMLFYNMKVMGVDTEHVYKRYKERIRQKNERAKIMEVIDEIDDGGCYENL